MNSIDKRYLEYQEDIDKGRRVIIFERTENMPSDEYYINRAKKVYRENMSNANAAFQANGTQRFEYCVNLNTRIIYETNQQNRVFTTIRTYKVAKRDRSGIWLYHGHWAEVSLAGLDG